MSWESLVERLQVVYDTYHQMSEQAIKDEVSEVLKNLRLGLYSQ